MYKLNKTAILGTIFIIGTSLPVSMTINNMNKKEEVAYVQESEATPLEQPVSIGQEINGCVVYKIMYRSEETKEDGTKYWTDWQVTDEFYIGLTNEIYNETIKETETKEIQKRIMGYIDNAYNYEHFVVTTRTYHEEYYEDGQWKKSQNFVSLENSIELPKRCMARWIQDSTKIEERTPEINEEVHSLKKVKYIENTLEDGKIMKTQTLEAVMSSKEDLENSETTEYQILSEETFDANMIELYQRYEVSILNGEFQYKPEYIYTTFSNISDSEKYVWKKIGYCVYSNQLEQNLSSNSIKTYAKTKAENI